MKYLKTFSLSLDIILIIVLGIVILLPKLEFISVSGTTTNIRPEDFILAIVYIVWIFWLVFGNNYRKLTILHKLMIVFIVSVTVSTIWGIYFGSVKNEMLGVFNILRRIEYFGIFFVAYHWLKKERLWLYIISLVGIGTVVVLVGFLQYFNLIPMFPSWAFPGQILYYRSLPFLLSTFGGHYDLGGYLILTTPITIAFLILVKNRYIKISTIFLLIFYYLLLIYSFSRAAYGGMIVGLIVLLFLLKKYLLIILPLLDALRILWLYFNGKFSKYTYSISYKPSSQETEIINRSSSTATSSATASATPSSLLKKPGISIGENLRLPSGEVTLDPGGAARVSVWREAWNHFIQNPIFGTGYSSIGIGSDNQYLRTLAETGLLGLGIFLSIISILLYKLYNAYQKLNFDINKFFLSALIAGTVGLLAEAVLIDIFDSSKIAIYFWFLAALGIKIQENTVKNIK